MRVLVIRFSSLGDVALTLPVLESLAQSANAEIDFLTKPAFASLLEGDARLRKVLRLDPEESMWALAGRLKANGYDRIVDLQANGRSLALCSLMGKPVFRIRKAGLARRLRVWFGRRSAELDRHVVDRYLDAVRSSPHPTELRIPDLRLSEEEIANADRWLASLFGEGPFAALHPLARHATKRWPAQHYVALADALAQRGLKILWLGAPEEKGALETFAGQTRSESRVWAETDDLRLLAAGLGRMRLVASNDSGPMHLAAAAGAPTLGIFGSTHRDLGFFPLGKRVTVAEVDGLTCRPCHPHGRAACPKGHFRCMTDLDPEVVAETAIETLSL